MNDSDKRYGDTSEFEGFQGFHPLSPSLLEVELPAKTNEITNEVNSFGLEFSANPTSRNKSLQ